eukprot:30237-Amphidinium_carterae.1
MLGCRAFFRLHPESPASAQTAAKPCLHAFKCLFKLLKLEYRRTYSLHLFVHGAMDCKDTSMKKESPAISYAISCVVGSKSDDCHQTFGQKRAP